MKVIQSCLTLCDAHGLYSPWNCSVQNTGVGSLSLLQGIFPTQGSNPCLPHCRWILYQLSPKGSPRILEWVAYPFSRECFLPGTKGNFFTLLFLCFQESGQLSTWSIWLNFFLVSFLEFPQNKCVFYLSLTHLLVYILNTDCLDQSDGRMKIKFCSLRSTDLGLNPDSAVLLVFIYNLPSFILSLQI